MISLKRPYAVPDVLTNSSSKRSTAESTVKTLVKQKEKIQFERLWGERPVRDALWGMQNGRCCYCERLRDSIRESDIEHFRPKAAIDGEDGYGYWWLAYDWNNLFFSCRMCNQHYKKTKFPIAALRATPRTVDLNDEKAMLIDPALESPEDSIGFDWSHVPNQVVPYGIGSNANRGNTTIEVCGLDRQQVCGERYAVLGMLKRLAKAMLLSLEQGNAQRIDKYKTEILAETSAESINSFIGFRRAFFRAYDLGEYVADD